MPSINKKTMAITSANMATQLPTPSGNNISHKMATTSAKYGTINKQNGNNICQQPKVAITSATKKWQQHQPTWQQHLPTSIVA